MAGEENEQKKRLAVKVGVWAISALILLFWAANLRNSFNNPAPQEDSLDAIGKEIGKTVEEIKEVSAQKEDGQISDKAAGLIEGLKEDIENRQATASSTPSSATSSPEAASSSPATSTIPVQAKEPILGCPQYINCMPTFGEPRPCIIPPGCENYTQIAY